MPAHHPQHPAKPIPTAHPGRPPLAAEHRRRHAVTFRASDLEIRLLRRRASLARLPMAAYVRASALQPSEPPRPVAAVSLRAYGQLGRLANNLNQLTKLAHQGRLAAALLPCLLALLAEVRGLRRLLVGLETQSTHPATASSPPPDAGAAAENTTK